MKCDVNPVPCRRSLSLMLITRLWFRSFRRWKGKPCCGLYVVFALLSIMPCLPRTLLAHRIEVSPIFGIVRQMTKNTCAFFLLGMIAHIASARQVQLLPWACFWLSFLGLQCLLRSGSIDRAPCTGFRDCVAENFPSMTHATPVTVPWPLSGSTVQLFMVCGWRSPLVSQFMAC